MGVSLCGAIALKSSAGACNRIDITLQCGVSQAPHVLVMNEYLQTTVNVNYELVTRRFYLDNMCCMDRS